MHPLIFPDSSACRVMCLCNGSRELFAHVVVQAKQRVAGTYYKMLKTSLPEALIAA